MRPTAKGIIHRDIKPAKFRHRARPRQDSGLRPGASGANSAQPAPSDDRRPNESVIVHHSRRPGGNWRTCRRSRPGQGTGCAHRHFLLRRGALRDGDRDDALPGRYPGRHFRRYPQSRSGACSPVESRPARPGWTTSFRRPWKKIRELRYQHASEIRTDLQRLQRGSESGRGVRSSDIGRGADSPARGTNLIRKLGVLATGSAVVGSGRRLLLAESTSRRRRRRELRRPSRFCRLPT